MKVNIIILMLCNSDTCFIKLHDFNSIVRFLYFKHLTVFTIYAFLMWPKAITA